MTLLLGDELCLANDNHLVLRERRILTTGADDLAYVGRVAVVERQVEVTLVLGQCGVDDHLLQAVDEVGFLALQNVDIAELAALDFSAQRREGNRFSFYSHNSVFSLISNNLNN